MAVPTSITDLNVVAASNSPASSDTVGTSDGPDDYLRALSAIVKREQTQGAAVASATTTSIGATTDGSYIHITGTTTITGFGTVAAGIERTLVFDGALTLTHNATSLILPGGSNITTAAGDIAVMRSEGSGNWRCLSYTPAGETPYVYGSWTPVVADASSGGNEASTGASTGRYVKIGRLVTATASIVNINTTGLTGGNQVFITGLPFASFTASSQRQYAGIIGYGATTVSGYLTGYVGSNVTYISMLDGAAAMTVSQITSTTGDIYLTISYIAGA